MNIYKLRPLAELDRITARFAEEKRRDSNPLLLAIENIVTNGLGYQERRNCFIDGSYVMMVIETPTIIRLRAHLETLERSTAYLSSLCEKAFSQLCRNSEMLSAQSS